MDVLLLGNQSHFRKKWGTFLASFLMTLAHSFPMHPFSTPWKHQKTVRFFDFQGIKKGCIGSEWVKQVFADKDTYSSCAFTKQDYPCITVAGLGKKDIKNDPNEEIDQLKENVRIAVGGKGLFKDTNLPFTKFFWLYYFSSNNNNNNYYRLSFPFSNFFWKRQLFLSVVFYADFHIVL